MILNAANTDLLRCNAKGGGQYQQVQRRYRKFIDIAPIRSSKRSKQCYSVDVETWSPGDQAHLVCLNCVLLPIAAATQPQKIMNSSELVW